MTLIQSAIKPLSKIPVPQSLQKKASQKIDSILAETVRLAILEAAEKAAEGEGFDVEISVKATIRKR